MNRFMQLISSQFESEEKTITDNLVTKAGLDMCDAIDLMYLIKDKSHIKKADRNLAINQVSSILRSNKCGLRTGYVHSLLAKISGLSYGYVQRIAYDSNPTAIIKSTEINQ